MPRLVATLGSQTSSKKISRKSIQDVNVHQACQTIQSTQAPLALRLQGNLLYVLGVLEVVIVALSEGSDLHADSGSVLQAYTLASAVMSLQTCELCVIRSEALLWS